MLGFIKKDLLLVKANIKTLFILFVFFVLMSFQESFNLSFILPFMSIMLFVSTFSYDDYNNWNTYLCSIPNGRINFVKGKYITSFILFIITILFGLLLSILVGYTKNNLNIMSILASLGGIAIGIILLISIMYPLIFKYGSEKGRIILFVIFFLIFGAGSLLLYKFGISEFIEVLQYIDTHALIILPIFVVVITLVSYFISKRIYLKKEF